MTAILDSLARSLRGERAWMVGGAVRDELLGRPTRDYDVVLDGDARQAARALARATRGTAFSLSEAFGTWRVLGPEGGWRVDMVALRGADLLEDLAARDFTVNAMARPLAGGELVDPLGGRRDLRAGLLRPASPRAFADDPLRALRAIRFAVELGLQLDPATRRGVVAHAPHVAGVAGERVFAELKRVICADAAIRGLRLMDEHGLTQVILPELSALHGVVQNVFHHLDVHDHTLAVLEAVALLARDPARAGLAAHGPAITAVLGEPLGDELTRGQAMRFAALLHDAAKPQTREVRSDGRVTFIGHDAEGVKVARSVLHRLRASAKVIEYVEALTREHLRLGFMVHELPLTRRAAWRYMAETSPYEVETTLFTVADRLATRGRNAEPAIAAHLEMAGQMLEHALARRAHGPPPPLVRGNELMRALGLRPGPLVGRLLAQIEEDRYAGELSTPAEALERARELAGREDDFPPRSAG